MDPICAVSLTLFILFVVTLLTDIFDSLNVLYSFSLICSLVTCLVNSEMQQVLLQTIAHPILILLSGLAVFSFVFSRSIFLEKMTQLFASLKSPIPFMTALLLFTCLTSGILNNTLIVSSLIPIIKKVCLDNSWKIKKFLLPLSFVSMLGGTITLIGSSTNLVAVSLLEPEIKVGILDLVKYSLPTALVGIIYLTLVSSLSYANDNVLPCCIPRENVKNLDIQLTFLQVTSESNLIGKCVRETHIQEIGDLQLCGIQRGDVFSATPPRSFTRIHANDILTYVSCLTNHINLVDQPKITEYSLFTLDKQTPSNGNSPNIAIGQVPKYMSQLTKKKGKDLKFKQKYNFVLVGIIRNQVFITQELAEQQLLPGDFIIVHGLFNKLDLETKLTKICHKVYVLAGNEQDDQDHHQNNFLIDFVLAVIFVMVIISGFIDILDANNVCLIGIVILLLVKAIKVENLYQSLFQFKNILLGTIASLLLTKNLELAGVLTIFSRVTIYFSSLSDWSIYFIFHLIASGLSSIISNVAVVSILVPIVKISYFTDHRLMGIIYCLIHGASCCFISPTGYHTNLMVHNIGNYSCRDYLKLGLPLNFLTSLIFSSLVAYL